MKVDVRFVVVEVPYMGLIHVECASEPDEDERIVLRRNGFHKHLSNPLIWSRKLTIDARSSAARACMELNW